MTNRIYSTIKAVAGPELAPGQFTVRLTGPGESLDYAGDCVVPGGVRSRSGSIILLRDHDPTKPIGRCEWRLTGTGPTASIVGTCLIPPNVSACGDDTLALIRAGVVTDVSVGFESILKERIPTGWRYTKWNLLEMSIVSIGCLPTAVITSKHRATQTPTQEAQMSRQDRIALAARLHAGSVAPTPDLSRMSAAQKRAYQDNEHTQAVQRAQIASGHSREARMAKARALASQSRPAGW